MQNKGLRAIIVMIFFFCGGGGCSVVGGGAFLVSGGFVCDDIGGIFSDCVYHIVVTWVRGNCVY